MYKFVKQSHFVSLCDSFKSLLGEFYIHTQYLYFLQSTHRILPLRDDLGGFCLPQGGHVLIQKKLITFRFGLIKNDPNTRYNQTCYEQEDVPTGIP